MVEEEEISRSPKPRTWTNIPGLWRGEKFYLTGKLFLSLVRKLEWMELHGAFPNQRANEEAESEA